MQSLLLFLQKCKRKVGEISRKKKKRKMRFDSCMLRFKTSLLQKIYKQKRKIRDRVEEEICNPYNQYI